MKSSSKTILLIILVVAIGAAGVYYIFQQDANAPKNDTTLDPAVLEHIRSKSNRIVLEEPKPNAAVISPLTVTGRARGNWFFEASFPVKVTDANGAVLGIGIAQAQDEWMTENFVPFVATVVFTSSQTPQGELVLEKDNPSGLPEHSDALRIPITFALTSAQQRRVALYYYNAEKDTDASGNVLCSRAGLEAVQRDIPITQTPLQDTIKLLLRGELTPTEKNLGITTEFPLADFSLTGASLTNGVLTLSFDDPNNRTSGGSCRAGVLSLQIEETAKQFPGVTTVRFIPEELFQP